MSFSIERNDLAAVEADAIVVAANESLQITGGVGWAVAKAAGLDEIQAACNAVGFCPRGSAVATPAFGLKAKTVVHAVGPVWRGGGQGEVDCLRCTYSAALECAVAEGAHSIALPLLSAGTFGFPADISLAVARESIRAFLNGHDDVDVRLALYSRESVAAGIRAFIDIAEYIDDRYIDEKMAESVSLNLPFEPSVHSRFWGSDGWGALQAGELPCLPDGAFFADAGMGESALFEAAGFDAVDFGVGAADTEADEVWADAVGIESAGDGDDFASEPLRAAESDCRIALKGRTAAPKAAPKAAAKAAAKAAPVPKAVPASRPVPKAAALLPKMAPPAGSSSGGESLQDLLDSLDEPFSITLLALIDERGMTDAQVYKRANMSRQLFSKIRSDAGYRPTKKTVLALSVALELDLDETRDLLSRAGFALTRSSKSDVIVEYFIEHGNFDIFQINEALYAFDQPLL